MRKKLNIGRDVESRRRIETAVIHNIEAPKQKKLNPPTPAVTDEIRKEQETPSDTPPIADRVVGKKKGGGEAAGNP